MEIKVYKEGNDRKLDISGFSQAVNGVKTFNQFALVEAIPKAGNKVDITLNRTNNIVTGIPSSAFKDFNGNPIGTDAGTTAAKIGAIWSAREEKDSYIIGDDLSQKSEDTQFVHNTSIANGGAVILETEAFKAGVEGNFIEMEASGTNGSMDFYVDVGGNNTSHKALRIYGASLTQSDARIDFLDTTIENLSVTSLTEVPSSLGTAGQVLAVNSGGTALEFVAQSGGGGGGGTSVTLAGSYDYLTLSGQQITLNQIDYSTDIANIPTSFTPSSHTQAWTTITGTPTTISGYGITDALQLGTTSTTALAGNTDTITPSQASAITANTAKVSADGLVTTHSDVTDAGSGSIITASERSKLVGIAAGAEVNVNADWNATSGDEQILNKPSLFSGAYADLTGKPAIPSDIGDLTDVPASLGTSGQVLAVNSGATALEYVDQSGGGGAAATLTQHYVEAILPVAYLRNGASVMNFNYATPTKVLNVAQTTTVGSDITWANDRFTVGADGLYTFNVSGFFNTVGIERAQPTFYFYLNGTKVEGAGSGYLRNVGDAFDHTSNFTRTLSLSANDYVELYLENTGRTSPGTAVRALGLVFEATSHEMSVTGVTVPNTLVGLTDTPASIGSPSQVLAVNSGGTAVEFVDQSGGSVNELNGIYLDVVTRSSAYGAPSFEGQVVKFGTGTLSAGKIYVLRDNGGAALWDEADADAEIQTKGLLGMALGTSPTTDGLLVRGMRSYSNSFTVGAPLYISLTAGTLTDDLSSHTTGDFVRTIGYSLSTSLIYLDPSPDYIELG